MKISRKDKAGVERLLRAIKAKLEEAFPGKKAAVSVLVTSLDDECHIDCVVYTPKPGKVPPAKLWSHTMQMLDGVAGTKMLVKKIRDTRELLHGKRGEDRKT